MSDIVYRLDKTKEIPVSERKLNLNVEINYASKSPRFVATNKNTVILGGNKMKNYCPICGEKMDELFCSDHGDVSIYGKYEYKLKRINDYINRQMNMCGMVKVLPKNWLVEEDSFKYTESKRIDDLGRVVIPKVYRHFLNINAGDELKIELYNDRVIIRKV